MPSGKYASLREELSRSIPPDRILVDPASTFAWSADASFYRLVPKVVVKLESEAEVLALLHASRRHAAPLTFRAAGTSLSGQAVSASVLAVVGRSWRGMSISPDGGTIRLGPGAIGGHANAALAPLRRKIGPDPASIDAATIGGIVANNASGMCCGTAQNSYRTLESMRILFADGTVLDTGDPGSRRAFLAARRDLVGRIASLSARVKADPALANRIRGKYRLKNTTGYGLNALIDFDDPIDVIEHLMVGSEGTLGFLAEVTLRTVPELPHRATSLLLFPEVGSACAAVSVLRDRPLDAVELMDRASLRSVEEKPGMPGWLRTLAPDAAALLVETRSDSSEGLERNIREVANSVSGCPTIRPIEFTSRPEECARLWDIRKGLFPSVGAARRIGTTVIIEDVAFPLPRLAEATADLRALFERHGYGEAIIFGHALEGNLHFVLTQDFGTAVEVERYRGFLDALADLVVGRFDGSLKAEHGTGRNMAPFVEREWGPDAYGLMREIKAIFDPEGILNPGVILNEDPEVHVRDLKALPPAHPAIDRCTECGFCESRCPSRWLTLSPRQRIAMLREIERLRRSRGDAARLRALEDGFAYSADETCAADGLCETACPVGIDTGRLIKDLRRRRRGRLARAAAEWVGRRFALVAACGRLALTSIDLLRRTAGPGIVRIGSSLLRAASGGRLPAWNPCLPRGAERLRRPPDRGDLRPRAVYFPACVNRTFGPAGDDEGLSAVVVRLLEKAGYAVVFPDRAESLCCGMAFDSKGFPEVADRKVGELEEALRSASRDGRDPILVDMSPCFQRMRESFGTRLDIHEPVGFAERHLLDRLEIRRIPETVAVHVTCSSRKLGLGGALERIAARCADRVIVPAGVGCCGQAGDRGFWRPELTRSALAELASALPDGCRSGYSTSRTCEVALSLHGGVPYRSILYLLDRCSTPRDGDRG